MNFFCVLVSWLLVICTMLKRIILTIFIFIAPLSSSAQVLRDLDGDGRVTTKDFFLFAAKILTDAVIPLLVTVALIVFIVGIIQYMAGAADQTQREKGKKFILWGIIGLFVIIAIWGILKILTGTFDVNFALPQLKE